MKTCIAIFALSFALAAAVAEVSELPEQIDTFLVTYCLDCHDDLSEKGGINLDFLEIDWSDPHSSGRWSKAWEVIEAGEMPPEEKKQPTRQEALSVVEWLGDQLMKHDRPGGTLIRRLSREEYENSVSDLLKISFTVPDSFPTDHAPHGFDNHGADLVLSPPLMAQYLEIATSAADQVLPPATGRRRIEKVTTEIGPGDFTLNFTTGHEVDGVLRMVSSSAPLARGSVWPNRFEAKVAGIYRVVLDLSYYRPIKDHTPEVHLLSRRSDGNSFENADFLPKLAEFTVTAETPSSFVAEVELQRGETLVIHYENAPLRSDQDKDQSVHIGRISEQILDLWRADPELGAAWMKAGFQRSDRGWSWHERIENLRATENLDVDSFDPESPEVKEFAERMARQPVNLVETMCCFLFEKGPGIDIHNMAITGPIRLIEGDEERKQKRITERFLGERNGLDDRAYAKAILRPLIDEAFRRPATDQQLENYLQIALRHQAEGNRFEDGLHLALRAVLCSPNFLYRGQREGELDNFDLAARLSFFLTSAPPDATLRKLAGAGRLSDPIVLEAQARRLLQHQRIKNFLTSFTGQWLDLRVLPDIMPDSRLLNWTDNHLDAVTAETEMFVAEILAENHPIDTFIDPTFTYLNRYNAALYDIPFPKSNKMARFEIERGGRHGGILGQASIMMATANGVDTQPVLRGVWLLENVLGDMVPEPPADVPAVEPDTSGANSIRELLAKHNASAGCVSCHKKIDPPGFALENFDPVGRWRDHYPVYEKVENRTVRRDGIPVDAAGVMKDGTVLNDVTDLKRYLVDNIDIFSRCLSEKLLVYATGRDLSFGDKKEVERIVHEVRDGGNGFQDLIVSLILSESFATK
ncbi:MAG: DUF1592 domain-containing protein [Verrucomicrobiota bacterium]